MSSEATATTPRVSCLELDLLRGAHQASAPPLAQAILSLRRQTCGCSDVPWVDGGEYSHGSCGPKFCLEDVPWRSLGFPDQIPEFRRQPLLAARVCRHSGVGHPRGPDRQPWGVARKISPAQETGFCCFFFFFVQTHFSNLSVDLASRVLPRLWVQCWVGCPIWNFSQGLKAPAATDLKDWLNWGSLASVKLIVGSQPLPLSLRGHCFRRCWALIVRLSQAQVLLCVQFQLLDNVSLRLDPELGPLIILLGLSCCFNQLPVTLVL